MRNREGLIVRIQIKDETGKVIGETDAVSYKGLLSLAHDDGLREVSTKLLQHPTAENRWTAIVMSRVVTRRGSFSGIGDASPESTNPGVGIHAIRVAETRATARALRAAVNIGEVALEELAGNVTIVGAGARTSESAGSANDNRGGDERKHARTSESAADRPHQSEPRRIAMSEAQKKLLFRLAFDLGATREDAHERVLVALGLERLEWATREDASRAIDKLQSERDRQERPMNGGTHA